MTKSELIEALADRQKHLAFNDVELAVKNLLEQMSQALSGGERIEIRGFGSFITKKRAAKIGRNIKKNVAVHIPEHFIPAFTPAKEFVQEVKKLETVKEDQPNPDAEM